VRLADLAFTLVDEVRDLQLEQQHAGGERHRYVQTQRLDDLASEGRANSTTKRSAESDDRK